MSHINDIQRRPDAKAIVLFLIYVCFLIFIFHFAIHHAWADVPLELLVLPVCLAIPLFHSRFYLSLMLLLSISVIVISHFFAAIEITNNPLFIIFFFIACVEILFFLRNKDAQYQQQLLALTDKRINRLSALRRIDLSMISNLPLQDTLSIVVQELQSQFHIEAVNIFVLDRKTDMLTWHAGNHLPIFKTQFTQKDHPAQIHNEKNHLRVMQLNSGSNLSPELARYAQYGYQIYIVLPLLYNKTLLGTIEILSKQIFNLDDDFTNYLEMLGGQTAIAIKHATSLADLQNINHTLESTIKELTETKDVLEKSQHIGRIGSWRYKLETGQVEWTQALFDLYDLSVDQFQPTFETILENIVPDDVEKVRKPMNALLLGENINELEYRIQPGNGEIRNLIAMCEAYCDEHGKVVEIIGTVRDRTEHKQAELQIREAHVRLQQSYDSTLEGWAHALDLRDHGTEGHSQRVTQLSLQLAEILQIPQSEHIHIRRGAILHDIGKIGIPDTILLKPGKLTEDEWHIMRQHPQFAYDMLSPISYLKPALDIPFCHHEKWDGSGYPQGLRGKDIPLSARIFAIVDVLDALTSDRPYRKAWTLEEAKQYIIQQSGTQFDPEIVSALMKNWNRIKF